MECRGLGIGRMHGFWVGIFHGLGSDCGRLAHSGPVPCGRASPAPHLDPGPGDQGPQRQHIQKLRIDFASVRNRCCKKPLTRVRFLEARRQALVPKLEASRVQSAQLPLPSFSFQERRKILPFSAILSFQFYESACNFINLFKRYSFVNNIPLV